MSQSAARRFAFNALLLIAVNLLMRTVGVSFNVYLSNRAGGEVMGLYSLLSGVYTFAMTLGCGGIHLGTTRMVADAMGQYASDPSGCEQEIKRCLRRCIVYSIGFGTGAGVLLFTLAPTVGESWLGDGRTVGALRVLALTLPPIAISSCLGGYFTARRHITPSAVVGITSQLVRIGCCVYLLSLWLGNGIEATCMALVVGGALAEFVGLFMTWIAYLWDTSRQRHIAARKNAVTEASPAAESSPGKKLLGITLPVTFSACIRSGLITLQHILIPRGLKASGSNWSQALSSYGVLHSMVLPVVLFPSAFISSFSGLLVPEIAESHAASNEARVARISERIIRPALFFSFGVAGIMSCFSYELGLLLYNSTEAGAYIRQLAPLIPIMYVDSSVDGVLKGMGEQVYSMNVNIADALASVIMVWLLLPRMGLQGYVVTIYVTETLNTTLSLSRMLRVSGMKADLKQMVFGPLLCVVGATCGIRVIGHLLHLPSPDTTPGLVLMIAATAGLYILLAVMTKTVGAREWGEIKGLLPFAKKERDKGDA